MLRVLAIIYVKYSIISYQGKALNNQDGRFLSALILSQR